MESTSYGRIEDGSIIKGPKNPPFVAGNDKDGNFHGQLRHQKSHRRSFWRKNLLILFLALFLAFVIGLRYLIVFQDQARSKSVPNRETTAQACKRLRVRREWRSMASSEKAEYIAAVQCLRTRPASMAQGSLYDDFPYVHKRFGSYSHKSAAFLPWHRYFILLYENTLREKCNYSGSLPSWD